MRPLHDYQQEAIDNLRDSIRNGLRRIVVQAPTGAGKTRISAEIVDSSLRKGNKVAFVVPAISLVDQTVESFYSEGIRGIGVIQANHEMTNWSCPVQICSIQTIRARKAYPEANTVIFDECHRVFEAHKAWLQDPAWENVPMIGLSATPWTKGLGKYFHSLLKVTDTATLIQRRFLSPFRVFATGHPDLSKVKTVAGDYHEGELSDAMQQGSLTADIIKTYQAKWGKGKTLCFGVDKLHAKSIQERFEFAGIRCGYQDAETTADERREIKKKFHSGEYEVVSNIQTLTTGVDWDVRCLILARPTKSEMLYVQIIGRALRTAPGKDEALILDHSDTTARLGFVTDIDHDQLSDGKPVEKAEAKEKKDPLPKECEACAFLMPPKITKCPNCGHDRKPLCSIYEADGELQEIVPGQLTRVSGKKNWRIDEKRAFFAELKGYARDRDYKEGWAANKYRERIGVWPDWSIKDVTASAAISPATSTWIHSCNIRWAKSKHRTTDEIIKDSLSGIVDQ
jgi:superfamily II DNA or RNA helicase